MSAQRVIRFSPGFSHASARGAAGVIRSGQQVFQLPAVVLSFERFLAALPAPALDLPEAMESWGPLELSTLDYLASIGIVEDSVVDDAGIDRARAERPILPVPRQMKGNAVALGSTTCFRRVGDEWLASSADSRSIVWLEASVFASLAQEVRNPLFLDQLSPVARLMLDQGLLRCGDQSGRNDCWDFHDALFHAASVHGFGTRGYGARSGHGWSQLKVPELGCEERGCELVQDNTPDPDISLVAALEQRQTCRVFSSRCLAPGTIEALLRLALRSRPRIGSSSAADATFYAYPSGGARGEIAPFVAMEHTSDGMDYMARYDSRTHTLQRIQVTPGTVQRTTQVLCGACGIGSPRPSMAVLFAADYSRMAEKYDAIAYATILRNVGAIYQTVSLCATALGIGSCCVGGGWGALERETLAAQLHGRVLVGAMLLGVSAATL